MPSVGTVRMTCGTPDPGELECDGSAVSRTGYAALYATIGTKFGAGDGVSTFNLPDFRGRSPVAIGTGSGLTARSMAASGGEETHLLTGGEGSVAAHTHTVTDPGHTHAPSGTLPGFVTSAAGTEYVNTAGNKGLEAATTASQVTGISIDNASAASAGAAHNTMHPFLCVRFCIFTGVL